MVIVIVVVVLAVVVFVARFALAGMRRAGKSVGRDLLRGSFDADSAAWYVRDPAGWREEIQRRSAGAS